MNEKILRGLCRGFRVSLRLRKRKNKGSWYEGVKWVSGRTKTVYICSVGKLESLTESDLKGKLDKLA